MGAHVGQQVLPHPTGRALPHPCGPARTCRTAGV